MPSAPALLLALLVGAAQPPTTAPAPAAAASASAGSARADSTKRPAKRVPRHADVTPDLERTAFADASARSLLMHARAARLAQDSALQAYDAKTYQRFSIGMGLRRFGRDRLLFRHESAARVHWDRTGGVTVEPTAERSVSSVVKSDIDGDMDGMSPIPYFPGRESLWFPSSDLGVAKAEVDDRELVHPLAAGAEAYYRYATGDSMSVKLPDGRRISLREMRITPRRPDWHLFVGSFWFDVDGGQLVRAAYRMSVDMDIWQVAEEESSNELRDAIARAAVDTSIESRKRLEIARREAKDDAPPGWVKGMLSPMKATISMITVEYGLHDGRFWLPRRNVAEGDAQAGFMHIPLKIEESFQYDGVSAQPPRVAATMPNAVPRMTLADARTPYDSAIAREPNDSSRATYNVQINVGDEEVRAHRAAQTAGDPRRDSTLRAILHRADSLGHRADSMQATGDTARARRLRESRDGRLRRAAALARRDRQCQTDSVYDGGVRHRFAGALGIHVLLPCDPKRLANSPDLPKSAYDPGDELFSSSDRDELVKALDLSLQPGWAPQPVKLHSGLDLARYNRIEALSIGGSATSALGAGYTAQAIGRIGIGDWVPNAELSIARSDGRHTIRLGAYHRLGVANDDWGSPLSFGASLASLLYSRDEGFYYRTFGAELTGSRAAPFFGATVDWRLFGERQRTAGWQPNTQFSLGNVLGNARFIDNIAADQVTTAGGSTELTRSFGVDPTGWRLLARGRGEAAFVSGASLARDNTGYGRLMAEGTLSRGFGGIAAALTGAAGGIAGDAPIQRQFFIGGLQTVRGQYAHPTNASGGVNAGYVGDAFWLGRAEVGTNNVGFRPVVFFDAGWAGARADVAHPGRPLTGAGVGASFLDGLVRADLARGIYPEKKVRFDLSVEARF